jgi:hypothetical protein
MPQFSFFKTFCLLFLFQSAFAQVIPAPEPIEEEEEEKPVLFEKPKAAWKANLHYGGNFSLGFFGAFYVDASPMVGYDVSGKGTILGTGAAFIFQGQYGRSRAALSYGGRLFVRQAIWKSVFAHGEYEFMNATRSNFYPVNIMLTQSQNGKRQWGGSPLVGLGLYRGGGAQQKGSFISLMYNLGAPNNGFISPQTIGGSSFPVVLRVGYFF